MQQDEMVVRVIAGNGKRYKVALYHLPDGSISARWVRVQLRGAFNRASSWRSIDRNGEAGRAAITAAIEELGR